MSETIENEINQILSEIKLSDGSSLQDRSSKVKQNGRRIGFSIDISGLDQIATEESRRQAIAAINDSLGEVDVNIVLTSSKPMKKEGKQKDKIHIDGVRKVILVTSGKGGVGKSTITALLAQSLASDGKKVAILDADIYGPSIPHIFGINEKPELEDKKMVPLLSHGVYLNSIGFITDPTSSISWRGPMISKALYQLISLTKWDHYGGELDYLLIDMTPGTGDIHLSLLENYHIDSALIITTPQKVAGADVVRAINLYQKMGLTITGIIENMSYLEETISGKQIKIFAGNSGEDIAKQQGIDFLGAMPILPALSSAADGAEGLKEFGVYLKDVKKKL